MDIVCLQYFFSIFPVGILYYFSVNHIKKLLFILVPMPAYGGRSDVAECIAWLICFSSKGVGHVEIPGCNTHCSPANIPGPW